MPHELMPPIENELAEDDFNDAVSTHLYLFEDRREAVRADGLALKIALRLRVDSPSAEGGDNEEW